MRETWSLWYSTGTVVIQVKPIKLKLEESDGIEVEIWEF